MKIKTALNWLTLLISVTAATNAIATTTTYTITRNTGEGVMPYPYDFSSSVPITPSNPSKYGDMTPDPVGGSIFKDTLKLESRTDCHTITSATLSFDLKCDRGLLSDNECWHRKYPQTGGDSIQFVSYNQPQPYLNQLFWSSPTPAGTWAYPTYTINANSPVVSLNSPSSFLTAINNSRRISFQISDFRFQMIPVYIKQR